MFTGLTAPQKRNIHNAKDQQVTSLVGLFFTLFNQTFDHLMASPSIEFSVA